MIVDQFNVERIFSLKTEDDPPVCPYRHRPETAKLALERMQAIAWEVERLRRRGLIEAAQNVFYIVHQIRSYAAPVIAFKEAFQSSVFEVPNQEDIP